MPVSRAMAASGTELFALIRDQGAPDATQASRPAANTGPNPSAQSSSLAGSATTITLSDRAKVIMAKAREDQKVADRLDQIVSAAKGRGNEKTASLSKVGAEILAKYGDLPGAEQWAANASADNLGLLKAGTNGFDLRHMEGVARTMQAGGEVRLGQENMSEDEQFVQSIQLRLAGEVVDLENAGLSDKAQALRDAINSGTVKVQKSDDVPELNLNYTVSHYADAGGGGTTGNWVWNPTGAARAALDSRQAIAIGGVDRGAFFLSW